MSRVLGESKPGSGAAGRPRGWFPEILKLGSRRIRGQVRLLGFAALVGVVAGLGGIAFYVATRAVEHYALGVGAGYFPHPHPGGEPSLPWLARSSRPKCSTGPPSSSPRSSSRRASPA